MKIATSRRFNLKTSKQREKSRFSVEEFHSDSNVLDLGGTRDVTSSFHSVEHFDVVTKPLAPPSFAFQISTD